MKKIISLVLVLGSLLTVNASASIEAVYSVDSIGLCGFDSQTLCGIVNNGNRLTPLSIHNAEAERALRNAGGLTITVTGYISDGWSDNDTLHVTGLSENIKARGF